MEILRPLPGAPAPVLSVDGRALVLTREESVRRWPMPGLQLARYRLPMSRESATQRDGAISPTG